MQAMIHGGGCAGKEQARDLRRLVALYQSLYIRMNNKRI
jgi:hypothetical protein